MAYEESIPPAIVLVAGHAGAGKDTVAAVFTQLIDFELRKFADPLYDMLAVGWGMSREELDARKRAGLYMPGTNATVRHALQTLGTEWGRAHIAETVWPAICAARIEGLQAAFGKMYQQRVVVSDLRFMNELTFMRERFGDRCRIIGVERASAEGHGMLHASEQDIAMIVQDADIVLQNNDTIAELDERVESVIQSWFDDGWLMS